jgi:hypothetical protein
MAAAREQDTGDRSRLIWINAVPRAAVQCIAQPDGLRLRQEFPVQTIPVEEAVAKIPDRASLLIGGFMGVGTPERALSMRLSGKANATLP